MNESINELVGIKIQLTELMEKKKELEVFIEEEIRKLNLKQVKTDKATVSLAKRKSIVIVDEKEAIKQLEDMKLKQDYVYEQLDKKRYDLFAKEMIKTGKELQGCETHETEYLSVRLTK